MSVRTEADDQLDIAIAAVHRAFRALGIMTDPGTPGYDDYAPAFIMCMIEAEANLKILARKMRL